MGFDMHFRICIYIYMFICIQTFSHVYIYASQIFRMQNPTRNLKAPYPSLLDHFPYTGVSENGGSEYGTLNSRILIVRTPK